MPLGRGKKTRSLQIAFYRQLGEGDSEAAARRIWQPILLILIDLRALERRSGKESPLGALEFDGKKLRLQMKTPNGKPQDEMPWLIAEFVNDRFEGYYYNSSNAPIGSKLKLVRFTK